MSVAAQKLPSYALCTPEEVEEYARDTAEGHWKLLPHETFWRERYLFLESKRYKLRPRFNPAWKPSWLGTNRDPDFCEDSVISMVRYTPYLCDPSAECNLIEIRHNRCYSPVRRGPCDDQIRVANKARSSYCSFPNVGGLATRSDKPQRTTI